MGKFNATFTSLAVCMPVFIRWKILLPILALIIGSRPVSFSIDTERDLGKSCAIQS